MFSIIWFAALLTSLVPQSTATPAPADVTLPEIGRVKSISPACAVMRDLAIPAFTAARRADEKFSTVIEPQLPEYAKLLTFDDTKFGPEREMRLFKIGSATATMFQQAQQIDKLLKDPRLTNSQDPQIQDIRKQMELLYQYQEGRASILNEFQQRETVLISKHLEEDNDGLGTGGRGVAGAGTTPIPTPPPPIPFQSQAPVGQPNFTGVDLQDAQNARQWGRDLAAAVRASENQAARTFLPIAKSCL